MDFLLIWHYQIIDEFSRFFLLPNFMMNDTCVLEYCRFTLVSFGEKNIHFINCVMNCATVKSICINCVGRRNAISKLETFCFVR